MKAREHNPLTGKKIVLTRARHQINQSSDQLRLYGAIPIAIPTIEISDPPDSSIIEKIFAEKVVSAGTGELIEATHLQYEWIIFTSANGVSSFMRYVADWIRNNNLESLEIEKAQTLLFANVKFASIGSATALAMTEYGLHCQVSATDFVSEGLLEKFQVIKPDSSQEFKGRILLPRAAKARNILPDTLRKMGWVVDDVPVYQTIMPKVEPGSRDLLSTADAIVFTSSSTVTHFFQMFGKEHLPEVVVSIGPITTQTILENGLTPSIEASPSSVKGIVSGLLDYYSLNSL